MVCDKCGFDVGYDGVCINTNCISNGGTQTIADNILLQTAVGASYNDTYNFSNRKSLSPAEELLENFSAFVGEKNILYYENKYSMFLKNKSFISWNWCAFLITPYWLLYRKMYLYALGYILGAGILTYFFGSFASLILMAFFGLLGNQLYVKFVMNKISAAKKFNIGMGKADFTLLLNVDGGVTIVTPLILLALNFFLACYSLLTILTLKF